MKGSRWSIFLPLLPRRLQVAFWPTWEQRSLRWSGLSYNPAYYSADENPVFDIYDAGKKHVGINLKTLEGMAAMKKLLATADVFITNTRPAALYRREHTGCGDYVRSGLYHNSIFTMGTMNIINQPPHGRTMPNPRYRGPALPTGDYRCADGKWVFLSGYNAEMNTKAYKMLGLEHLLSDPTFATPDLQQQNIEHHYQTVKKAWLSKPSTYWLEKAEEFDLPLTRMGHYRDLIEDEQAWVNGYVENVTFPSGNTAMMPTSPIEMDSVGKLTTKTAPAVGTDTDVVFCELGYTQEEIEALRQTGAIK